MVTRKQLLALIGFVIVGALIIWIGRDDPSQRPKFEEQPPAPITNPSTAPTGSKRSALAPAGSKWSALAPAGSKWSALAPAGSKWSALVPSASQSDVPPVNTPQADINQITLPHDDPEFPPGPGRELFLARCTVCHSLRYITMQPNFSKKTWAKEVAKMINTYRAHITGSEAKEITDYLAKVKGLDSEPLPSVKGSENKSNNDAATPASK